MFKILTKEGTLQVDDAAIRLVMPFHKIVWEVPKDQLTRLVKQQGGLILVNVVIFGADGMHVATGIQPKKADELFALFSAVVQHNLPLPLHWYEDVTLLAHIATYTSERAANREVAEAAKYGWYVDNLSSTAGHVNVGRTATAAALTGGLSLLLGASRSKDKLTIAFARESDWLERYKGEGANKSKEKGVISALLNTAGAGNI